MGSQWPLPAGVFTRCQVLQVYLHHMCANRTRFQRKLPTVMYEWGLLQVRGLHSLCTSCTLFLPVPPLCASLHFCGERKG